MKRHRYPVRHTLLLLWFACTAVYAGYPIEIIELQGRPLGEVIEIVRPLVEPDGAVTGMHNQLILRTSPENLREIRQLLERIDQPPRRLMISVSHENLGTRHGQGGAVDLAAGIGDRGEVSIGDPEQPDSLRIRGVQASTRNNLDISHRVQTLEGRPAFIATGQSVPITTGGYTGDAHNPYYPGITTTYRDAVAGFYALPRLNGDRVTVEISPRLDRPGKPPGSFNIQQAQTVVSGRIGEWIAVGGAAAGSGRQGAQTGRRASTRSVQDRAIYLRVDEIP